MRLYFHEPAVSSNSREAIRIGIAIRDRLA